MTLPAEIAQETGARKEWLPFIDAYRTLCLAPPPEMKMTFERLALMSFA